MSSLSKTLTACCGLTVLTNMALAQDKPAPAEKPAAEAPASPKEAMLEKLFASMKPGELAPVIEQARKLGISQQILLEARFIHCIDVVDNKGLAALAPEFVKHRDQFDPAVSEVFSLKEDWLSIVHYTQALAALEKNDKAAFKKHIMESFWLSPRQAQAYAPHIEKLRMKEAMAKVVINPKLALKNQDSDDKQTIGSLMKDKKATVFHFWSPLSQEVQHNFPDFVLTTQSLDKHGIGVHSILLGKGPENFKDAEALRKANVDKAKCSWLLDDATEPLASLFRINDIPTMVVVSAEGKIVYNGHPAEDGFWQALQKLVPDFKRPNKPEHDHGHDHKPAEKNTTEN